MVKGSSDITPERDATLGLIFRLNALWAEVDIHAKNGEYDSWNNTLDAIYRNLLYREDLVIIKNKETEEIIEIKLSSDDEKEYKYLCGKISYFKYLYLRVRGITEKGIPKKKIVRSKWYNSLALKDIWLRKLMNNLGLYIKETVKHPGTAMWGGK